MALASFVGFFHSQDHLELCVLGTAGWLAGVCGPGQQDADADNAQSMNCIKVMNPSQDFARARKGRRRKPRQDNSIN